MQSSKFKINDKQEKKKEEKFEEKTVNEEAEALKKGAEELEDKYKRALADYQNLEKRVEAERREWLIKANKDLILRLLPALDFLLLSRKHIEDQGLKLSIQQFFDILRNEGVERIETEGKEFDPIKMEGVRTVVGEDNKVVEELRPGFIMGESVLRPAQVAVGSAKQSKEEIN